MQTCWRLNGGSQAPISDGAFRFQTAQTGKSALEHGDLFVVALAVVITQESLSS